MSLRVSRRQGSEITFGEPLRQPLSQDPLPAPAGAGYYDHNAIPARLRRPKKALEGGSSADLRMAVQVERCINLELAATDALFSRPVGRRCSGWDSYTYRS